MIRPTGCFVQNTQLIKRAIRAVCQTGDEVSVMRRVVETTSVILHHVTHSNNHFIMKRDVCGGDTEAKKDSWPVHKTSPTNLR